MISMAYSRISKALQGVFSTDISEALEKTISNVIEKIESDFLDGVSFSTSPTSHTSPLDIICVEGDYIKIHNSFFSEDFKLFLRNLRNHGTTKKKRRGRSVIKKLFDHVSDGEIVSLFKRAMKGVKETCEGLYQDLKQFCVCFYQSSFKAFSPHEDPYGKLSHFHRIISTEIENVPTRKTLNNAYKWFNSWKRPTILGMKEEAQKVKHILWSLLIDWIYDFLLKAAPQYVVVRQ